MTGPKTTPGASASILSITLQATDGIIISSDSNGVVRVWDISTGHCKESFQTPAKDPKYSDAQLINNRLIYIWCPRNKIYLQDVDITKGGTRGPGYIKGYGDEFNLVQDVKISGDGSRIFCLEWISIKAWSVVTGEVVGKVEFGHQPSAVLLTVDGSRAWAHSRGMGSQGWDFGTMGSPPAQLPNVPLLPPNSVKQWDVLRFRITDTVTGNVVFHLAGRFGNPVHSQWDGQYLVAGYKSGEVLILDFNNTFPLY